MKKQREINVILTLTEGYAQRLTEACLDQLRKRESMVHIPDLPEKKKETA